MTSSTRRVISRCTGWSFECLRVGPAMGNAKRTACKRQSDHTICVGTRKRELCTASQLTSTRGPIAQLETSSLGAVQSSPFVLTAR